MFEITCTICQATWESTKETVDAARAGVRFMCPSCWVHHERAVEFLQSNVATITAKYGGPWRNENPITLVERLDNSDDEPPMHIVQLGE